MYNEEEKKVFFFFFIGYFIITLLHAFYYTAAIHTVSIYENDDGSITGNAIIRREIISLRVECNSNELVLTR